MYTVAGLYKRSRRYVAYRLNVVFRVVHEQGQFAQGNENAAVPTGYSSLVYRHASCITLSNTLTGL